MAASTLSGRQVLNGNFKIVTDSETKKEIAECNICGSRLKYHHSTTTLKYHLEKKHPFTKISDDGETKSGTVTMTMSAGGKATTTSTSKQRTLHHFTYTVGSSHSQEITRKLCLWIAKELRPISICEDSGLQELLRAATRDNSYKLPGRTSVTEKLHDLYRAQYAKVKQQVSRAKHITLAFDHWTSLTSDNYTGVILVYVNDDYTLTHTTAGIFHSNESQTAENICDHITTIMNEWGISSAVQSVCTDNAANKPKAAKLLKIQHFPCMAHTLQLAINHGLEQAGLSAILMKCRAIVGRVKRSPLQKGKLQSVMKDSRLMLLQDVPTRWGSTLDMITRLIIQREAVSEWVGTQTGLQPVSDSEWKKLEVMRDLLQPCEEVCKLLGGQEYVTASVVLPALALLKNKMTADDADSAYARRFKEGLYVDICHRMHNAETNATLQVATALDIRFKSLKSVPKNRRDQVWTLLMRFLSDVGSEEVSEPTAPKRLCTKIDLFSVESDDEPDGEEPNAAEQEVNLYRFVFTIVVLP
jgi:hypothetical protein